MSLPTPSQFVSHKQFHQCVNHKKAKFEASITNFWYIVLAFPGISLTRVEKVFQKLTKSYKSDIYFNVASWFWGNVRLKPHFNTQWGEGNSGPVRHILFKNCVHERLNPILILPKEFWTKSGSLYHCFSAPKLSLLRRAKGPLHFTVLWEHDA